MLFMPAIERGVYCMLLCPPQRKTSPKSTSSRVSVVPSEPRNVKVAPFVAAGVGGRAMRHRPVSSIVAPSSLLPNDVLILTPGSPNPHTTACCGARCSTMPWPSVLERLKWLSVLTRKKAGSSMMSHENETEPCGAAAAKTAREMCPRVYQVRRVARFI